MATAETQTLARAPDANARRWLDVPVSPASLIAGVAGWFAVSNLLLWTFLGTAGPVALAGGACGAVFIAAAACRTGTDHHDSATVGTLLCCLAAALALLVISGEGRFFYANIDWQVRNGVLGDMGRNPWPFAYVLDGEPLMLRAPLGVYFVPAMAWHLAGERAASLAMLAQNAALLAMLLAACAPLFPRGRPRAIALGVFVAFSGLDAIGVAALGLVEWDHLENWLGMLQYSSTMTLLFWVPQHALAGWVGTAAYLLWTRGMVQGRLVLTVTPLAALWSPLALIGLMPFALHTGIALLLRRQVRLADFAVPAAATLLTLPALAYLGADPGQVGFRFLLVPFAYWFVAISVEVLPYAVPLLLVARKAAPAGGRLPLVLATAVLLVLPLFRVGESSDLLMRGSIPALAVMAAHVAGQIARPGADLRYWLIGTLAIGSITGGFEVARAFRQPPAPPVACTMFEAWDVGTAETGGGSGFSKGTYLAQLDKVPAWLRPSAPALVPAYSGRRCWDSWSRPAGF